MTGCGKCTAQCQKVASGSSRSGKCDGKCSDMLWGMKKYSILLSFTKFPSLNMCLVWEEVQ